MRAEGAAMTKATRAVNATVFMDVEGSVCVFINEENTGPGKKLQKNFIRKLRRRWVKEALG